MTTGLFKTIELIDKKCSQSLSVRHPQCIPCIFHLYKLLFHTSEKEGNLQNNVLVESWLNLTNTGSFLLTSPYSAVSSNQHNSSIEDCGLSCHTGTGCYGFKYHPESAGCDLLISNPEFSTDIVEKSPPDMYFN